MKPTNNKNSASGAKKSGVKGNTDNGEMNLNPEFFGLEGMPDILPSDHEYHTYLKKIYYICPKYLLKDILEYR